MKGFNSHVSELRRVAGFLASFALATAGEAALYTTSGTTPSAAQSWGDVVWQPGPTDPTPGNTYEILQGGLVQNPPGDSLVFPGDALMVDRGARLRLKGTSPVTLSFPGVNGNASLVLNGGRLQVGDDNTFTIDGQIAAATNSLIDLGWGSRDLVITAQLSGEGNLILLSGSPPSLMDIQSTNNPYSGNWLVVGGYLKGTSGNSLGAGNITVNGGTLEISYDIQTPGALTLLGSNSVMVLHQDCQFSAVTINGDRLEPGTYSYTDLAAQFPGNFAEGGSGNVTITSPIPTPESLSATGSTAAEAPALVGSAATMVLAVTDSTAPATPSSVTVSSTSPSQMTVSWSASTDSGGSGLAGYQVYRGGVLLGTTTGTSYTDNGLAVGVQYCYTIVAYDNAGNDSPATTSTCLMTLRPRVRTPVAPSSVTVSSTSPSQMTVSWSASTDSGGSGLAGYQVYRGGVLLGTTTGTSYTDNGLAAGVQYCYTIVAYDNAGNDSLATTPTCLMTLRPRVSTLVAPSNLAAVAVTSASVTLNWQDNSNNEAGFQIERAPTAAGPWSVVGSTGANVISYADTTVVPSTTYYYQVLAFN